MKKALAAGLVLAGIIALSGTSFAEVKVANIIKKPATTMHDTKERPPEPPRDYEGRHPHTGRDGYGEREPPEYPDRRHPDNRYHGSSPDRRPSDNRYHGSTPDRRPPDNRHHRVSPDRRPPLQQGVAPR
ncbi:MAG: hypothetical protein IJQ08_03630 [Synergistaceae bacterium]|nr:hypothetical protein [Synergistaceae bacterium]